MLVQSLLKVMYPAAKRSDIRAMLVMARGYEHRHVFPMRLTVDQMKQVFAAHDDDHSGTIEIKEFVALLSNAGAILSTRTVQSTFNSTPRLDYPIHKMGGKMCTSSYLHLLGCRDFNPTPPHASRAPYGFQCTQVASFPHTSAQVLGWT